MQLPLPRYLRMRVELYRCDRERRKLRNIEPDNSQESYESGEMQAYIERSDGLYEWRHLILTDYWESLADGYGIPMPDRADRDLWDKVDFENDPKEPKYLTDAGIRAVRALIREEQKHRREVYGFWVAAVVGLVGSITGLVSVLKG